MNLGKLGVWYFQDAMTSMEAAEAARKIEKLGFGTLWIPETVGKSPVATASWLLSQTKDLNIATGIMNIYHREPGVTLAAQKSLAEQSGNRFLLGIGVSHKPLVEGVRGLEYRPPVATMRSYLEKMQGSPYTGRMPEAETPTVIAALGPKMLALAAEQASGAHPYFTSPEHTRMAREVMGEGPLLCVEQKVICEENPEKARATARPVAKIYHMLPNYRNNWLRMGLTDSDIDDLSDRFIDATFAWGSMDQIRNRIQAHHDAGADHVCIQPIHPEMGMAVLDWDCLEALSPN
ncbi:MAG: TIGR03620 family F420-dependent LLM class oxidoreductase [Candidatus Azotimanducaceae bacterium]